VEGGAIYVRLAECRHVAVRPLIKVRERGVPKPAMSYVGIADSRSTVRAGTSSAGVGIPEPVVVDEPAASWRSLLASSGWRVNVGHPDYRALSGEPRARLRYLVALFAKDVTVVTTHAANEPVLDRMIDVLAHAERTSCEGRADALTR
jgi:hypothetical protein